MKKLHWIVLIASAVVLIGACEGSGDTTADVTAEANAAIAEGAIPVENAFWYTHVDGHKTETEKLAFVLFEYEQLRTVKYQIGYIMCTCRGPEVNYYSVAFVELNKSDGSVASLSFDGDSSGHYTAGLYGDSVTAYDGTPVLALFEPFVENELIGASQDSINAMQAMHGQVDGFTGATVTPNNTVRMLQGLFKYHNEHYAS
jgi:hypothetical protein